MMKGLIKGGLFAAILAGTTAVASPASALVNLALNQPTTASSQNFGAAALANDGSTVNTYPNVFQSGFDVNPYWIVDLGSVYTLNDVHIFQRDPAEDGGGRDLYNWTLTLYSAGTLAAPTGVVTANTFNTTAPLTAPDIDITTGVTGQNARFVKINLNASDYLSLAEVQVFQQAAAVSAVPEPATAALALIGVVAAAAARRRGTGAATA